MICNTALCGLGKSAPLPVLSTIKAFREEYEEHIRDKKCRTHTCQALREFKINQSSVLVVENVRRTVRLARLPVYANKLITLTMNCVSSVVPAKTTVRLMPFM